MAYKCKLPDPYSFATPEQISKIEFICATLSKMKHGKHHRFKTKFSQNSCVVCLDNFTPDSDIHITNECEHVFHSTCLRKWYCNIQCNRPLTCPHCTVENTPRSRPLEFSWEFQSEPSFHVNMPHTCVLPTSIRMLDSPYDNPGD